MKFTIEAVGIKEVELKLENLGRAAADMRPAIDVMAAVLFRAEEKMFDSQGRRGGGSWRRLTDAWTARKVRGGLDPRIGHATLALRRSVTVLDAPGQILEISPHRLKFGSDLEYAATQQRHRPFMRLLPSDIEMLRAAAQDYLMAGWGVK